MGCGGSESSAMTRGGALCETCCVPEVIHDTLHHLLIRHESERGGRKGGKTGGHTRRELEPKHTHPGSPPAHTPTSRHLPQRPEHHHDRDVLADVRQRRSDLITRAPLVHPRGLAIHLEVDGGRRASALLGVRAALDHPTELVPGSFLRKGVCQAKKSDTGWRQSNKCGPSKRRRTASQALTALSSNRAFKANV